MEKRRIIFIGIFICLLVLLSIGVSYSYWKMSYVADNTNSMGTTCFSLSLTNEENIISLSNIYPITDTEGKALTPYTFTVTNTCDMTASYTLNLAIDSTTTLNSKYVAVMIDSNDNKLLSEYDTNTIEGYSEARILDTEYLASGESINYSLRIWLDESVTLDDDVFSKTFSSKIVIVGEVHNGIIMDANGGYFNINGNTLSKVVVDSTDTMPIPLKEGYTFEGWYTKDNIQITSLTDVEDGTTLYANYSINSYTITYDYNYLPNDKFSEYYDDTTFNDCCSSTKTLSSTETYYEDNQKVYKVSGTYSVNDSRGWYFSTSSGLTLGSTYTFSFDVKGSEEFTVFMGSEETGYTTFNVSAEYQHYSYTFVAKENSYKSFIFYDWVTTYERTIYIRNLQMQEGTLNTESKTYEYNTSLGELDTPTRDNYTFLGWYTDALEGTKVTSDTLVTGDTTYYAHWKYNN